MFFDSRQPEFVFVRKAEPASHVAQGSADKQAAVTGTLFADEPVHKAKDPTKTPADNVLNPIVTNAPFGFDCRLTQLLELISERGTNGMERLEINFGGLQGLFKRLKTSPTEGIAGTDEDIEVHGSGSNNASDNVQQERQHLFGKNAVPSQNAKTFFELVWETMQDPILLVLAIAGILSAILGITVEQNYDTGTFAHDKQALNVDRVY